MSATTLMVIAKDPQPGLVKTRLCPPCSPEQAARLAEAALRDTLDAVLGVDAGRHVLVLDGDAARWRDAGLEIVTQCGGGLDERLDHAFAGVSGPALLVGMDTPQLTPELLREGLEALTRHDSVLGPTHDGGYWGVGLSVPRAGRFAGVPMSVAFTLAAQRRRFDELGLSTYEQATLTDVDTIVDARCVARKAPGSRFATVLTEVV
jgi:hypothetical protein